jgi:hypothetical protein
VLGLRAERRIEAQIVDASLFDHLLVHEAHACAQVQVDRVKGYRHDHGNSEWSNKRRNRHRFRCDRLDGHVERRDAAHVVRGFFTRVSLRRTHVRFGTVCAQMFPHRQRKPCATERSIRRTEEASGAFAEGDHDVLFFHGRDALFGGVPGAEMIAVATVRGERRFHEFARRALGQFAFAVAQDLLVFGTSHHLRGELLGATAAAHAGDRGGIEGVDELLLGVAHTMDARLGLVELLRERGKLVTAPGDAPEDAAAEECLHAFDVLDVAEVVVEGEERAVDEVADRGGARLDPAGIVEALEDVVHVVDRHGAVVAAESRDHHGVFEAVERREDLGQRTHGFARDVREDALGRFAVALRAGSIQERRRAAGETEEGFLELLAEDFQ